MPRLSTTKLSLASLALGLGLGVALAPASAEDLDGAAIMDRADKQNRPKDERCDVTMTILSPRGEKRRRELVTYFRAGAKDDDKLLVRFEAPADVKGTGLLTIEEGDDDEQWLYLPDLRKSKRIAGATKSQSFMGTDFSNYDMRTEDLAGHVYTKTGEETVDGRACYVLEAKPKDDDVLEETGYSKRILYVDKERFVCPKVVYFDRHGKLLKEAVTSGFTQIEGLWRGREIAMENRQEGSKTLVVYEKREVNKGLDEDLFTRRKLERP